MDNVDGRDFLHATSEGDTNLQALSPLLTYSKHDRRRYPTLGNLKQNERAIPLPSSLDSRMESQFSASIHTRTVSIVYADDFQRQESLVPKGIQFHYHSAGNSLPYRPVCLRSYPMSNFRNFTPPSPRIFNVPTELV